MFKKIVTFVLVNLVWPVLREILTDVLKQLLRATMSGVKSLMRKWKNEELAKTEDDAEKAEIEKRFADRQADLDALEEKLVNASAKIVQDAMAQGEVLRNDLLLANSQTLQKLESPLQIQAPQPNNSFKSTPLRGAA